MVFYISDSPALILLTKRELKLGDPSSCELRNEKASDASDKWQAIVIPSVHLPYDYHVSGSCVREEVHHVFSQQMKCSDFASVQDATRGRSCTLIQLATKSEKNRTKMAQTQPQGLTKTFASQSGCAEVAQTATSAQLSLLGKSSKQSPHATSDFCHFLMSS